MSFWGWLGSFFTSEPVVLAGGILLFAASIVVFLVGLLFASTGPEAGVYKWGWNLLIIPGLIAVCFLGGAFGIYLPAEVAP